MTLPNFLILGTAKAGTSTLARYLSFHPEVCFARIQEPNFFAFDAQFNKGPDFYRSLFAHRTTETRFGEKSWRYACHDVYPQALERIRAMLPELQLVYVLRDPLKRGISMWRELRDGGQDIVDADPERALLTDPLIIDSMRYASTFRRFSEVYGAANIKIVFFEDLVTDPQAFYKSVTDFLGIAPFYPDSEIHENRSIGLRSDGVFLEWLRRNGLDRRLRRTLPEGLRLLGRKYLKKPIGEVYLSDETRKSFLDVVRSEAKDALRIAGRPADFWTLQ
jgi:hypothetical protein